MQGPEQWLEESEQRDAGRKGVAGQPHQPTVTWQCGENHGMARLDVDSVDHGVAARPRQSRVQVVARADAGAAGGQDHPRVAGDNRCREHVDVIGQSPDGSGGCPESAEPA